MTRIGVHPTESGDTVYVWYLDDSGDLIRAELDAATMTWGSSTPAYNIGDLTFSAAAIHPVSDSAAILVAYDAPHLLLKYCIYDAVDRWDNSGQSWVVWSAYNYDLECAQFSDAEFLGNDKHVIVLDLAHHGAAHSVIYNSTTDTYSQPRLLLGSGPTDTLYRVRVSGLSTYNSRLWAVTQRGLEASDESPQARHVALVSTADGVHWREEDFVGVHPCFGKLLYPADTQYCYVVGNASVYRAGATAKLGSPNLTETIDEVSQMRFAVPQAGTPSTLNLRLVNQDGAVSDSSLYDDGDQIVFKMGTGNTLSTIYTAYLEVPERGRGWGKDEYTLTARGPLYHLVGNGAYRPPTGVFYSGPTTYVTDFNFSGGNARQSISQVSGTWKATRIASQGRYLMKGGPGLAIVPRLIHSQYLSLLMHFQPKVSVEGDYIVFWYEDEENYWRAGFTWVGGAEKLVIQRVVDGTAAVKASRDIDFNVDYWYAFYLVLVPGSATIYVQAVFPGGHDLSKAYSLSYSTASENEGTPLPHHVGIEIEGFDGWEGALKTGTVTKSFAYEIQGAAGAFDAGDLGRWITCRDQWRRIVDYTAEPDGRAATVDVSWGEWPEAGDGYGVYSAEGKEGPHAYIRTLMMCDLQPSWTADDIVDNILELSGVTRNAAAIDVADTAIMMRDVDVRVTGTNTPAIIFHTSMPSGNYAGWKAAVTQTQLELYHTAAASIDGWTLKRSYPLVIDLTGKTLSAIEFRFLVYNGTVYIYGDGHALGAFMNVPTAGAGYTWGVSAGTTTEFPSYYEAYPWDRNRAPNQALAMLLQGRHAKMIERPDGTLTVSRFDARGDLGTWSTPIIEHNAAVSPAASLIETESADSRAYYIEPDLARYSLRYRQGNSPAVYGDAETLTDAKYAMQLAQEDRERVDVTMYVLDPACELEDKVTVDNVACIVDSYQLAVEMTENKYKVQAQAGLRKLMAAPSPALWGTATWGTLKYG